MYDLNYVYAVFKYAFDENIALLCAQNQSQSQRLKVTFSVL